jgi:hypothetical protein
MMLTPVTRGILVVVACMLVVGCVQPPPRSTAVVCDPDCSERPKDLVTTELRDTGDDDGRIAALEAIARKKPRAAYDLALRFFRGDGVARDSYKALTWMRVAAEHGEFEAQKALGRLYLTGLEEMGQDAREAQIWLKLAASRGDKEARKLLAEAETARRSDEAEWKWLNRWRPVFYHSWYQGYRYYGTWNGRAWNYY